MTAREDFTLDDLMCGAIMDACEPREFLAAPRTFQVSMGVVFGDPIHIALNKRPRPFLLVGIEMLFAALAVYVNGVNGLGHRCSLNIARMALNSGGQTPTHALQDTQTVQG